MPTDPVLEGEKIGQKEFRIGKQAKWGEDLESETSRR